MVYMLFDNPNDKKNMVFLANYDTKSIIQVYPKRQCKAVKEMISFCIKCLKKTENNDTIICWYDFMGIICWWLCKIQRMKRNIIILNILLKDKHTFKNNVAHWLYRYALKANNTRATVTSKEYGDWLNYRLGLNEDFYLLHDAYHGNYVAKGKKDIQNNIVFCGGRNGRDWPFLIEIAKNMPDIMFNMVMPKEELAKHEFGPNINAVCDISQIDFLNLLCESELVAMPLDTEAPAGLIVLLQAAVNMKAVIASDTMTTREYLGEGRGALCKKDVKEWTSQIKHYLNNRKEARDCTDRLLAFVKSECSEDHYVEGLKRVAGL